MGTVTSERARPRNERGRRDVTPASGALLTGLAVLAASLGAAALAADDI